jgi:pyruvate formate lyase activating enzyme
MGLEYKQLDTQPPSRDLLNRVLGQFRAAGCQAR